MARKKQPVGADAPTLTPEFLASVGGSTRILKRQAWSTPTALTQGGETTIWDFGWIPEECRDAETQYAHQRALDSMPRFAISGTPNRAATEGDKADLCSLWKHPDVIADNGSAFTGIHQITGSCFPAGVPVRMADGGEKPVEAITVGDTVVTHTGSTRQVVELMRRDYTGEMVTLHVAGFAFPLTMTADHPVAILTTTGRTIPRWPSEKLRHSLSWVPAGEVAEGDRVIIGWSRDESATEIDLLPLLGADGVDMDELAAESVESHGPYSRAGAIRGTEFVRSGRSAGRIRLWKSRYENAIFRRVAITESFARLIGLYLAEGGTNEGRVTFTFSAAERETLAAETLSLVLGIFGVEGELRYEPDCGRTTVRFNNQTLAAVFKAMVPGNVYNKRVPGVFFQAPIPIRAALVGGWFAGDGYYRAADAVREPRIQGVTASSGLARDLTTLSLSVGYKTSCSRRKARGRSREAWDIYLSGGSAHVAIAAAKGCIADTKTKRPTGDESRSEFGYARAVKRVEKNSVANLTVYDFEVEEDHSFLAGGFVVHNCVGAGGGNMWMTLACVERVRLREAEFAKTPFWLLPYGRSRFYCGMKTPGEGSLGSCFADAAIKDGTLPADTPGLPAFTRDDGYTWGRNAEMAWSDGDAQQTLDRLPQSRQHLIKTAAKLRSASDVREALFNGYPITCASMYAHDGGKVQGSGSDAVLLARRSGSWSHQMSILACRNHPQFGWIYWLHNQWGLRAHGICPSGMPHGGVYIVESDVDWICRDEVYAFSGNQGFPAPVGPLDWIF